MLKLRVLPAFGTLGLAMLAAVCPSRSACAQWVPNGAHLTSRPEVAEPTPVGDGVGGAYVLAHYWGEYPVIDVAMTRIAASGRSESGWPLAGAIVDRRRQADDPISVCRNSDGSVTATIFAAGATDYHFYSTRYTANGQQVSGWDPATHLVTTNTGSPRRSQILAMPDGGDLFVTELGFDGADIWLSRFNADGTPSPGWTSAGHEVAGGPGYQTFGRPTSVLSDGADGAWLAFDTDSPDLTDSDVHLQHVDGLGNPAPGFPIYGRNVTVVPGRQVSPAIVRDASGDLYVAWSDARSGAGLPDPQVIEYYDLYLQRFTPSGDVAPGWPAGGLPVCVWPGYQGNTALTTDDAGGVYITWGSGGGPQGNTIHTQHILGDATVAPGWPAGGKRMVGVDGIVEEYDVCRDQQGGLFLATYVAENQNFVWIQHVTFGGVFDWPAGAAGTHVVTPGIWAPHQEHPRLVESAPGKAIVFWNDYRLGYAEAYASLISTDGIVATTASLVDHVAAADHVALTWQVSEGAGVTATIERREGSALWSPLGTALPDGTGLVRYDDHNVTPGAHYTYRLAWGNGADVVHSSETDIVVPLAFRFALTGATPNPALRSNLRIAFSLAERSAARLELFDAQGRNVATRDVTSAGPGVHTVALDQARSLGAGLYWLRLTQGARQATARVVLID